MTDFLKVSNLSRLYDDFHAVDDISFGAKQGEFIALLGPSGCGKSTTLKMIAGLEAPSAGSIEINGKNVVNTSPGKRNLSMVFQSYALFPHMTVQENILFGLKARKVERQERNKRFKAAVEMVDLGAHIHKKPSQLSGGQCQRVALARTIVSKAPLCLMDEPLSNLDTKLRAEMRSEIRSLQKELGLTVVYVTHDQIEAMSMADSIILLNEGRIEQASSPEVFYERPETPFVARFIGHPPMNLISFEDHVVGVRPEHINLVTQDGIAVAVLESDYQGSETILNTSYQDSTIRLTLPGKQVFPTGAALKIQWAPDNEHHFSSLDGHRIDRQKSVMNS